MSTDETMTQKELIEELMQTSNSNEPERVINKRDIDEIVALMTETKEHKKFGKEAKTRR